MRTVPCLLLGGLLPSHLQHLSNPLLIDSLSSTSSCPSLGHDGYVITPKANEMWFSWSAPTSIHGLKYSAVASAFTTQAGESIRSKHLLQTIILRIIARDMCNNWFCQALDEASSRLLKKVWRVFYVKEPNDPWMNQQLRPATMISLTLKPATMISLDYGVFFL